MALITSGCAAVQAALFAAPDLLLLDEPTNHLSIEAVLWLQVCERAAAAVGPTASGSLQIRGECLQSHAHSAHSRVLLGAAARAEHQPGLAVADRGGAGLHNMDYNPTTWP